ncbi:MAG: pro-sigmaK processing inhibitor BofA family protein [Clostridiales bacterium]|nr:pro-sigmaK processing inhibitor BofA family protein [Clostridiales bacterium]
MPWWGICLIIFSAFLFFAVIHRISKSKHPFKRSLLSLTCGLLTLLAVNLSGTFTGVYLPVSLMSILISMLGGIPGVTLMLGLNLFF